jgi:hypothetical protein
VRVGLTSPVTSGNASAHLKPGEFVLIPNRQNTWYGIAVAATPQVLIVACDL